MQHQPESVRPMFSICPALTDFREYAPGPVGYVVVMVAAATTGIPEQAMRQTQVLRLPSGAYARFPCR